MSPGIAASAISLNTLYTVIKRLTGKSNKSWIGSIIDPENAGGRSIAKCIIYRAASGFARCVIELRLLFETVEI